MNINRDNYLNQLIRGRNNGLVKIITGIRRSGKSFLVFNLFKSFLLQEGIDKEHIVEIQLDQIRNEALRNPYRLADYIRVRIIDDKQYFILIDEIQMCGKILRDGIELSKIASEDRDTAFITFYDVLNEFRSYPNVDLYVTGSNSKSLSSDIATTFRDRGDPIQIHPLSFGELSAFRKDKSMSMLREYMTNGGMPLAVLKQTEEEKKKYLIALFANVFIKDIIERHKLRDALVINKLTDLLCSSIGSLTNPGKLVRTLNSTMNVSSTVNTLQNYLDYLVDSFLFKKAERYDIKGRHYLDFPSKYYAEDVGLRNARLNFRQIEWSHLMENVIYNELIRRGCTVDVGVVMQETRQNGVHQQKQNEIDFVVNSQKGKIYIQSAFGIDDEKHRQEIMPLKMTNDFFSRMVVTGSDEPLWTDEDGVSYVGVIPFLLNDSILHGMMK